MPLIQITVRAHKTPERSFPENRAGSDERQRSHIRSMNRQSGNRVTDFEPPIAKRGQKTGPVDIGTPSRCGASDSLPKVYYESH